MSYKDKTQQREYQRAWAEKKRIKKGKEPNITLGRSTNVVTWEQLQALDEVGNVRSWHECIDKAKSAVKAHKINRLLIATLALRACIIKHGGDVRSHRNKTLTAFCKQIELPTQTVYNWITIKTAIADKLPKNTVFDYAAAYAAVRDTAHADSLKTYEKLTHDQCFRSAMMAVRYAHSLRGFLNKYGPEKLTERQLEKIEEYIEESLIVLRDYKKHRP